MDMDKEFLLEKPKGRCNSRYIKNNFPDDYNEILKHPGIDFPEKLYNYLYNDPEHICPVCGKITPFRTVMYGYSQFCSVECSYNSKLRTNKIAQTCLKKYGVKNASQSEEIKKKKEETSLKNCGETSWLKTKESKDRLKQKCLEKYGVENPSQSEEIKKKKERTCLKNHGVTCSFKMSEVREKLKNTLLEKYGVENAFLSKEVQKKSIEKKRDKFLGKWDLHIGYSEDGKWICKCPYEWCDKCTERVFETEQVMFHDRMRNGSILCTKLLPVGSINRNTTIEIFIKNILDFYNITYIENDRSVLKNRELDIYIPSHKIAIECNGIYWHSDIQKTTNYHIEKFKKCSEKGIQLLTIWEDWIINKPQIVESLILSKLRIYNKRIYGRECEIKELKSSECSNFLENNHIQGKTNSSIRLGLYYNDELQCVMTFNKSRSGIGKSYEGYELSRFCNKKNTQVIGGASKLFNYFIKKYNPKQVISYSSNDISNGNLYKQLRFETNGKINPAYWYIKHGTYERFHRYNFRKQKLKEMGYDTDNMTEREIMMKLPYHRIHDSGTVQWIYQYK